MAIRYILVRIDEGQNPGLLANIRRWIHSAGEGAKDFADIVIDEKPTYLAPALTEHDYEVVHDIFSRCLAEARDRVREMKRRADRG